MSEYFSLSKLLGGERKERLTPERLSAKAIAEQSAQFATASKEAYEAETFAKHHAIITDAIGREAFASARHFAAPIKGNGPWKDRAFWNDMRSALKNAADTASSPFARTYKREAGRDVPDTSEEGEVANNAAFNEPGPALANRVFLMEAMARILGPYNGELATDAAYREMIAGRVDEALGKIGLATLTDLVVDELRRSGVKDLPAENAINATPAADRIARIRAGVIAADPKDSYSLKILDKGDMRMDSFPESKNPGEALFLRLAVVGIHATWETAPAHRDKRAGEVKRMKKDNYRPLPDYIPFAYQKLVAAGTSPEDAALMVAFELYKDARIMREEGLPVEMRGTMPPASMFISTPRSVSAVQPERKNDEKKGRTFGIPTDMAVVTAAGFAAAGALAPDIVNPGEKTEPSARSQRGPVLDAHDIAAHMEAPLTETVQSAVATRENGYGAIDLVASLVTSLEMNREPRYLAAFDRLYPPTNGQNARARAHELAQTFSLWEPGRWEALIMPGSFISYVPDGGVVLENVDGTKIPLTDRNGAPIGYRGPLLNESEGF